MTVNEIPNAFVWTKIQADAGQSVDQILNRKWLEHQSGGTFWWGIGESKAEQIGLLVAKDRHPTVIFSQMVSRPHRRDSHPDGVLLWETYETTRGQIPLPPHAVVTSRAHDSKGRPKKRHYALVCESPMGILCGDRNTLDAGELRNIGDGGKPVGSSQVTAVVEQTVRNDKGRSYPITARATLIAPYAVKLTGQRELSPGTLQLLNDASLDTMTSGD
jgi:hypothetical protein